MITSVYMNSLSPGEAATVSEILHTGEMRRRLQDIGLIRGDAARVGGTRPESLWD